MVSWTFDGTKRGYGNLWRAASIKDGNDRANADKAAATILANEARYRDVERRTSVPWFFIAGLHYREGSLSFNTYLGNGQPINQVTTIVPQGRGPFPSFEDGAVDALQFQDFHRIQSWSVERMLWCAETFNGIGYVSKGVRSPYVWAGTTNEQSGLYVRDHVFDTSAEDKRLGVAAILLVLSERRQDVAALLVLETADKPQPKPAKPTTPTEVIPMPAPAPGQPPELSQMLQMLLGLLTMLMQQQGRMQQQPAPEPIIVQPPPPPPPALEKPSVQLGTAGLMISTILQAMGVVGTPFGLGAAPTETGTLATLIPLATTAIGATGGFGTLARIGIGLLGALAGRAQPQK